MNILGVGGTEFLIILVIMLIVAGPKRMIHWSGIMGQYVAKFRRMWAETVDIVQKEFDEAGVDIQLPRDVPTRGSLNKQAGKMLSSMSNPIKETMDQVNTEIGQIKEETTTTTKTATAVVRGTNTNGHSAAKRAAPTTPTVNRSKPTPPAPSKDNGQQDNGFGAWSSYNAKPDVGSWATPEDDEE